MARLKQRYQEEVAPALAKEFGIKNPMAVPRLDKIILNMGMGEAIANAKVLDTAVEELKAIVDETHGWGKKVACHAYNGIGLQRALDGGCDSIEHGLEISDAQIAQMARQGTWYCPTLSPYYEDWGREDTPEGKRDRARAAVHETSFKKALQAHLKIVFGTDIGGMPWTESIAREFGRMVGLGMSPAEAIQSATSRSAELLDMKGEIGVVASGAFADIIAVSGDPLKDVSALEHVRFVMHDGAVFKNEYAK